MSCYVFCICLLTYKYQKYEYKYKYQKYKSVELGDQLGEGWTYFQSVRTCLCAVVAVDDVRMVMMGVTQWLEEGEGNNKEMTGGTHSECFKNTNALQIQIQIKIQIQRQIQIQMINTKT